MWQAIQSLFRNAQVLARRGKSLAPALHLQPANGTTSSRVALVGLVTEETERLLLSRLSSDNGWEMRFVNSCAEAQAATEQLRVPVILCDRDLPDADWRDAVEALASAARPACVILLSGVVDDYLWEEVIRRGGYDVLAKPLRQEDVVRVVKLAWSFWNSMMRMPAYSGKSPDLNPARK